MTQPSEWAMQKAREVYGNIHHSDWGWDENDFLAIARALDEAKAEEREACAQIAEQFDETEKARNKYDAWWLYQVGEDIATAIRARGQ